jgi:hypothetical protein
MIDVHVAIHLLTYGSSTNWTPYSAEALAMYDDAVANGGDFVPGPEEIILVFLYSGDGGIGGEYQESMIEMRRPPDDDEEFDGCTPGYWKTHFDRWPAGYTPDMDFDTVFGTDLFDPDRTLGQALWTGGGGADMLGRHGTAALLNAAHGDVEYPYTVAEVIQLVQDFDAGALAFANEEYECGLGGSRAQPKLGKDNNGNGN